MFAVDHILISDDLLDAPFSCLLGACRGGCCVHGESGAPLEPGERALLEAALPRVRKYLTPEALAVIERDGVWEEVEPGAYATTCVDGAACVFVTYDGPVAKCALQKAYLAGRIDFPKPISCHLFPVRVQTYGDIEVLNYEQVPLCEAARKHGRRHNVQLVDFLREPLVRKYGMDWYEKFRLAWTQRRDALAPASRPG
ncbi:DUF3109 family protein [Rhodocaloribacter litoris]|uniref:DUF3109 family protein n=1 Tax=Rhodocaloribacter litoris TaxID=2558931 RepID=UPI0014233D19|nr:DUF3109 family protein [Rhodocaloribacter litoris]QXD16871.1 DUF3109 family protein [Rhodocaloribacter litoris]